MIRLPKIFKRNADVADFNRGQARNHSTVNKSAPRSFQRSQEIEELALTEDPERQRARHRLIGAAFLVLLAVVGLPQILDNKPKSVNNDIAVNIVTSLPAPNITIPSTSVEVQTKEKETSQAKTSVVAATPELKPEVKTETMTTQSANKPNSIGLASGEEVITAPNLSPKAEEIPKKASTGKYVIQIGAFASEDRAKGWIAKMKDQKIPNYVLNKVGADGTTLYVLRAGPFTDKEAAEAAEKKVKNMGLSPRLVEVGAP
jgi:DedD protein